MLMRLLRTLAFALASARLGGAAWDDGSDACAANVECATSRGFEHESSNLVQVQSAMPRPKNAEARALAHHLANEVASHPALRTTAQHRTCDLQAGKCPIAEFAKHESYRVFPGGKTGCLNAEAPYYFQVSRGDPEKLLLAFQGGGFCWDRFSFQQGFCATEPFQEPGSGILNRSDPRNPYKDYTIVVVLHCSGDGFTGSASRAWGALGAPLVNINGFHNMNAALDWTEQQCLNPTRLVVAGWSAGGLATLWWSQDVLSRFLTKRTSAVVLHDSFLGGTYPPPFQPTSQGLLFEAWGSCSTGLLSKPVERACLSKQLTFFQLAEAGIKAFSTVKFVSINSKTDRIQILFLRTIAQTQNNTIGSQLTPFQYYQSVNTQLQALSKQSNFFAYLINGEGHIVIPTPFLFTATPLGFNGPPAKPTLVDWINDVSCNVANTCRGVCIGKREKVHPWPAPPIQNPIYCDDCLP